MDRREALLFDSLEGKKVRCNLCGHSCVIADSNLGKCRVRRNIDGSLYSLNYGKIVALAVDPIEKKPLYHFFPGAKTLSIAMPGCNFKCRFCQNSGISQVEDPANIQGEDLLPEDIIKIAKAKNIKIISYTYSEPTVFYEFMLETCMLAKTAGMYNVMVTNGFMGEQALEELLRFVDAFNVDLKSFRARTYEEIIGGKLDVVMNNLREISNSKSWLEVTSLIIPEMNNSYEEVEDMAGFVASLGSQVPWHVSGYHPDYKMKEDSSPTSFEDLKQAYALGLEMGLKYVYIGNHFDKKASATICPSCGVDAINRTGFSVDMSEDEIKNLKGRCPSCGEKIDGRF
ncbi:MAG: AmmeMemoRadiSam system radical SAM enzyme [Oligoflexia bacterium]|nr:AmmeMemoRadiSam system radical SAM enzyme [Oligoflexia bacterium]